MREFWERFPDSETPLRAWFALVRDESWDSPPAVKAIYKTASILKKGRVVFNIAGNKYRLVVRVHYDKRRVYVRFIGTHLEYDEIDAETV